MYDVVFSPIEDDDVTAVVALWEECGLTRPWNDPRNDIAFAREKPTSTILVGRVAGHEAVISSVMVGHDGHRGWYYYLSVNPLLHGEGIGRKTAKAAEIWLLNEGIWKAQLLIRRGNEQVQQFYDQLGYNESACLVMEKWLDPSKRGDAQG